MQKGYLKIAKGKLHGCRQKPVYLLTCGINCQFLVKKGNKHDELKEVFMNTGPRKKYCKTRIDQKDSARLYFYFEAQWVRILRFSTARLAGILRQGIRSRSFSLIYKAGELSK